MRLGILTAIFNILYLWCYIYEAKTILIALFSTTQVNVNPLRVLLNPFNIS